MQQGRVVMATGSGEGIGGKIVAERKGCHLYIAAVALEDEAEVGKQFVEAAKQAGRRVVFSSVIHPVLSELSNHAGKAPVEEALLDSGTEYDFLQPAMFFQTCREAGQR